MRRFLLTAAVAATALAGTACGDSTGIGNSIAGSYELRTVNNLSLPVSSSSNTVLAGELDIDSNGEFVEVIQFEDNFSGARFTETRFGFWDRNGDELIFEYDDNGETRFGQRVSSSRIVTEDFNGNIWSYVRF